MTDEEIITIEPEESAPDSIPEPDPVPAPEPVPDPAPEPEPPSNPVEVIPVEDLLDRIINGIQGEEEPGDGEQQTPPQEEEGPPGVGEEPAGDVPAEPIEVVGMDKLLKYTETIQKTMEHPMMTTPFEDYTETEGLLLLLLLSIFVSACAKLLKGGFAWLR